MRWLVLVLMFAVSTAGLAQEKPANSGRDAKRWSYPPELTGADEVIKHRLGDVDLPMYVYLPKGHKPADKRPAIVFFFGGGWKAGSPGQFSPQCEYFASRGMVAITADYRVASRQGVKAIDCVKDAKSTIRWVRQHAKQLGVDPNKIVASGGSAGGHTAACTGVIPGVEADAEDLSVSSVPNAMALFNPAVLLAEFEGKPYLDPQKLEGMKDRVGDDPKLISPVHHVRGDLPPTIIFHGTADTAVPYPTVELFTKQMKAAGNRCELVGFEGQPHGFFNTGRGGNAKRLANDDRMYRETTYRLDRFLNSLGYLEGEPTIALPKERPAVRTSEDREGKTAQTQRPPNVVIIFADDQGYQDVGCFGSPDIETPNLDRMAQEGRKFKSFYVAQAVCGASRAALLTGCYSNRIGMLGAPGPSATHGIDDGETIIAEVLKSRGYKTAMLGKWHLGHRPRFLPTHHGFDQYFGLPYSNDMWPYHPTIKTFPDLPLIENDKVINPRVTPEDQKHLTTWYTERAVKFIEENHESPFFLYVAHAMPHVPLFVSDKHKGVSKRGLYGDVIAEVDWCVGEILSALKKHGVDENTLVIYTSDNGPWLSYGDHAGSALPLREGKGTTWEGGVREPCIMRWPGKIPAGTETNELAATIDLLPTLAHLSGADLPARRIDGLNIWPLMAGEPGAKTPHESYYYYWGRELQAIRSGPWKLHFPHSYRSLKGEPGHGGIPGPYVQKKTGLELYNLESDVGETTNVADAHPEVVKRLQELAELARKDLGDSATGQRGENVRQPARWTPPAKDR